MELDAKSWKILQVVQREGRISLTDLASKVALSLPATSERLKRLEEAGVIEAYRASVSPEKAGYQVMALVGMTTPQPEKARLIAQLQTMPEVLECLHVTGQDSFILRVVTRDIRHLERFVGSINHFGETRTSIVMSAPIPLRGVEPPRD
ncbi:Lrp/AsnC family transcriptional regulator [Pseudomonas sp. JS3066]|jgi:Lrp/AsnC family leucine-responsive transcriptional regulator|uniref:Lrp/AsnC family transcriptional regulator n=1 Tax=unclassified Pseudomonas TaxID=196821 RepID=UPI000EA8DD6A|nr:MULTISPECIES: Lrp/AsnC family transcriptional regulator [unclassified Pseudomonas]AYF86423.1 Lrp/AsnC family transcriptional regulator [Pseudomonas sp. DY-1]MRK23755.1 Lrp/AsnC family transcriptional regulator [Pseudomonas sp. JG-B]WVK96126.1 Lrp/AsnC family transcriptional regulator [Pseudomonas sp. JS3066]